MSLLMLIVDIDCTNPLRTHIIAKLKNHKKLRPQISKGWTRASDLEPHLEYKSRRARVTPPSTKAYMLLNPNFGQESSLLQILNA